MIFSKYSLILNYINESLDTGQIAGLDIHIPIICLSEKMISRVINPRDVLRELYSHTGKSPEVQRRCLIILDLCLMNGGYRFQKEMSSIIGIFFFHEFLYSITHVVLLDQALAYLQKWAVALENKPDCKLLSRYYQILRESGTVFPDFTLNRGVLQLFYDTVDMPEWECQSRCSLCRSRFFMPLCNRHHCRNCGRSICSDCTGGFISIPKFFISKTRVCKLCL